MSNEEKPNAQGKGWKVFEQFPGDQLASAVCSGPHRHEEGSKIVDQNDAGLTNQSIFPFVVLPTNVSLKSKQIPLQSDDCFGTGLGRRYTSGWHVFTSRSAARFYRFELSNDLVIGRRSIDSRFVIRKVKWTGQLATGVQDPGRAKRPNTVVAKEMIILKPWWKRMLGMR